MAMEVFEEWRSKPQLTCECTIPGHRELPVVMTIGDFGTWDKHNSLKVASETSSNLLNKLLSMKTINSGYCASGGFGLSNSIDQVIRT
jgi:hypothetical protein